MDLVFYSVTIILCLTALFFTWIYQRYDRPQNMLYISMCVIVLLNAISGVAGYFLMQQIVRSYQVSAGVGMARKLFQWLYFLVHPCLAAVFYFYSMTVTGAIYSLKRRRHILALLPILVTEILVITNPLTQWVYHFDSGYHFFRGWGELVLYLTGLLYLIMTIKQLLFSWSFMSRERRIALIYFLVLMVGGMAVQVVFIEIKSELFAESLALIGVMLTVESEEHWLDPDSGFYHRTALKADLVNYFALAQHFSVICIRIRKSEALRRLTASSNVDALPEILSGYLCSLVKRYTIYYPHANVFLITVMETNPKSAHHLAEQISKRFESPWEYHGSQLDLDAIVLYGSVPDELKTVEAILYLVDQPIPRLKGKNPHSGEDLGFLSRRLSIEEALQRALSEGNFQVYYQPTFHIDGMLHGAEALIRLIDDSVGFISPEEFIPIAEQMGIIDDVDDFVLDQVCGFLKSGVPMEHGMDSINVNLSVLQCMKPGFVERISGIVEQHRVEKGLVNFEITESVAASDYGLLSRVVSQMKNSGFLFSMDDYGTGYSNMTSMFSLDFDIVKIDKSILWEAEKSGQGMVVLESSIQMIQRMGQKILVEGVETKEQWDLLRRLGVDYLQGYYFSKPLPKEEFIRFIREYARKK